MSDLPELTRSTREWLDAKNAACTLLAATAREMRAWAGTLKLTLGPTPIVKWLLAQAARLETAADRLTAATSDKLAAEMRAHNEAFNNMIRVAMAAPETTGSPSPAELALRRARATPVPPGAPFPAPLPQPGYLPAPFPPFFPAPGYFPAPYPPPFPPPGGGTFPRDFTMPSDDPPGPGEVCDICGERPPTNAGSSICAECFDERMKKDD